MQGLPQRIRTLDTILLKMQKKNYDAWLKAETTLNNGGRLQKQQTQKIREKAQMGNVAENSSKSLEKEQH